MARKALGKGLKALIPDAELADSSAAGAERSEATPDVSSDLAPETRGAPAVDSGSAAGLVDPGTQEDVTADARGGDGGDADPIRPRDSLRYLPVEAIVPNPRQPRSDWAPIPLEELAQSILEKGLLEPVIVRPQGAKFELIAGERRWRACKVAGWKEIPAIVRPLGDRESLEAALIENLQRDDLNPVDEARAYQALMSEFGLTQEEVAQRVAKDRSTVSNLLRLLRLPASVLVHVSRGTLSVGHARVLVGLPAEFQEPLATRIVEESWSVRDAEEWAARFARRRGGTQRTRRDRGPRKSDHIKRIEDLMVRYFGAQVRIRTGRKGGRIEFRYHDEEELSRLLDLFGVIVS